jgi:hypothetical protein
VSNQEGYLCFFLFRLSKFSCTVYAPCRCCHPDTLTWGGTTFLCHLRVFRAQATSNGSQQVPEGNAKSGCTTGPPVQGRRIFTIYLHPDLADRSNPLGEGVGRGQRISGLPHWCYSLRNPQDYSFPVFLPSCPQIPHLQASRSKICRRQDLVHFIRQPCARPHWVGW